MVILEIKFGLFNNFRKMHIVLIEEYMYFDINYTN